MYNRYQKQYERNLPDKWQELSLRKQWLLAPETEENVDFFAWRERYLAKLANRQSKT